MRGLTLAAASLALGCTAAHAQATLTQTQIVVAGNRNVQATSLNASGAFVATLYDTTNHAAAGAVVQGTNVTLLPSPYGAGAVPLPKAIDDQGDILGYEILGHDAVPHMFLLKDGAFDPFYNKILVGTFGGDPVQANPIGFADRSLIFYTEVFGFSSPTDPAYGIPARLYHTPLWDQFQTARSINAHGVVAGNDYGLGGDNSVFFGQGSQFTLLVPPNAVSAGGGYINDLNQVAGNDTDGTGGAHGFVYQNGTYTSFDMPEAAKSVTVTGITDTGRVVGVYRTGAVQHAFLYNGTSVTSFDQFPAVDQVTVAINLHSTMLVTVQAGQSWRSYRVTCQGSGC